MSLVMLNERDDSRGWSFVVHSFDPLGAPCRGLEWIGKVLCFARNLVLLNSMMLTV